MAEQIKLDPERVERAKGKARLALIAEKRLLREAARERAKAESIARTWGFDAGELEV